MEKSGRAGQATDDNIIWRMNIAYWINKASDIHSEYVTCIAFFFCNNNYANVPQYFVYMYIARLV